MNCRTCQSAIENALDAAGQLALPLLQHLEQCSHCRAFYRRLTALEAHLRGDPSARISDEQVARIRSAVRQRLTAAPPIKAGLPVSSSPKVPRWHFTAAAAMLLLSGLGLYVFHQTRPAPSPDPLAQFVTQTSAVQNHMALLARLPERSLQAEMQKLAADARSAVAFIGNCIPAAPVTLPPTPEQPAPTP